jgi:Fe-S-cluster containining protein
MDTDDSITGHVALRIGGQRVELEMTVPARPVRLHRMLPVFQQFTELVVDTGVQAAAAQGETVSCKAGCGACCRQAVPLSEAEVQQVAELVDALPEPRRSEIRARFASGVARVRASGWFDAIDAFVDAAQSAPQEAVAEELAQIVLQYFALGVPCPFLEDESCSIHADRPLACREFLVSSPAAHCSAPSAGTVRKIPLPMRPSRALWNIANTGRFGPHRLLPLILALELAEAHPQQPAQKTGPEWMTAFFEQARR